MIKNITRNLIDPLAEKSNEEISDLIRDWLVKNAGNIALVIGLAIAMSVGYQWYEGRGEEKRSQVSFQMDALQSALLTDADKETGKIDVEKARAIQKTIVSESSSASLRDLSALLLAKAEDSSHAKALLSQASESSDEMVAGIARWQLALLAMEMGDEEAAKQQMELMRNGVMSHQVSALQGIVAQAKGDYQSALEIYRHQPVGEQNVLMEMMMNDLSARAVLLP
ncbi:MAG: tetratricopeptide repeat protein [Cardiobacteriaceae bacterium]|nr:tetratricopeptide repeat protein [Cardiobacteriaceae bacterium]